VLEGSSGLTRSEIERLQQEAELRQKEAETLRQEKAQLLTEFDTFKVNYVEIREERVAATSVYKALEDKLKAAEASANEATEEMKTLRDQLVVLRSERDKFRTDLEAEFTKANQKLQQDITRLQQDLTRVRAERDSHSAEIAECKAREQEKYRHVQEMKTLASSRQARIDTLVSEVYRLRMKVAAQDGDANLVQQYADAQALLQKEVNGSAANDAGNGAGDASDLPEEMVVRSLQSRVKELEALSITYKKHLQSFSEASDEDIDMAEELLRGEAQAKADLEEAQKKITKLEGILQTTDTANLSKRASEAEATVAKLEAKVKAHDLVSRASKHI
jgi:E3 ubiquitin-protein ligase BRE1